MTKMKRLMVTVAAAAGLLTLVVTPQAGAAQSGEGAQKPVTVAGLKLIPAHLSTSAKANSRAAAAADEQAWLIPGAQSGRCWDADLGTINANGTTMQLWDCNNTSANQAFYIRQIPEGYLRFQNVQSGRYLDADLGTINANGTKIQLWDYIAGAKNQWFAGTVIPEGWERFQSPSNKRYVTAQGPTGVNGTRLQLWDFIAGGTTQWWG